MVGDPRQGEVEGVLAEGGQGQHGLQPVANLHTIIRISNNCEKVDIPKLSESWYTNKHKHKL